MNTVGFPVVHGAMITGMHGIGVKTPEAAVVAAATVGFEIEEHMPKGKILTIGTLSNILASALEFVITPFTGKTARLDGTAPKEHCICAPVHTCCPIIFFRIFLI